MTVDERYERKGFLLVESRMRSDQLKVRHSAAIVREDATRKSDFKE